MSSAFLDTSGWFAAISPREARHKAALAAYRGYIEAGSRLVTTNLVVGEMQILVSRLRGAAEAVRFLDSVYQDASHEVIFSDRALEASAVDRWLRKFADQRVSLADAVSFEVMRKFRIREALALDEHFELAGYTTTPAAK